MRSSYTLTFGCLLATTLFAACSGGGNENKDAAPVTFSCQEIRACVNGCGDTEQACIDDCVAKGTTESKATFQAVAACVATPCPARELSCVCEQTCYADGACLNQIEACVGTLPADNVCDTWCH